MRRAGLPVIPGSAGTLGGPEEGERVAAGIGYPVLLKATAGGGGRGMRRVDAPADFARMYAEASIEAEKAFGNPGLYLEKYIVDGRHIEFQVIGDAYGRVVHLGERECSVQRRHQKLIEESPSPIIEPGDRDVMGDRICRALEAIGYRNAGTVEFLRSPEGGLFFMEVNARLQVEHPVTEMVTGRDLVVEQIRIAANEPLSFAQKDVAWDGHAIECRVNAEDPEDDFRPMPGVLSRFEPPSSPGNDGVRVRVDTHARSGLRIPPHYDSLLAKLIVRGPDRAAAIRGMIDALNAFRIEGVPTTIPVHLRVLAHPDFAAGRYDTGFVGRLLA
jgi:acetyl-CoA carboxylase biotin carboxylase subunit